MIVNFLMLVGVIFNDDYVLVEDDYGVLIYRVFVVSYFVCLINYCIVLCFICGMQLMLIYCFYFQFRLIFGV